MSRQFLASRKQRLWFLGALALLGGLALLFGRWLTAPSPPPYITQLVRRGDITQVVQATGTLQPVVVSPVGSQVSGIVWKLHADYNSQVKKGQVLVELDPALFQAAVHREQANVSAAQALAVKARADYVIAAMAARRARLLVKRRFIAMAERDTAVSMARSARATWEGAKANIAMAQAALDRARLDLHNSIVLSPVDGVVIARNVELGQAVVSSFQAPNIYTIAEDLTKMQVLANVDEADIGHLHPGQRAQFSVDSYRGRRFTAEVAQVRNSPQTVQNVVTYVVVLNVDNRELLLRPGMTANVRLEVARRQNALLVPSAALRFRPKLERSPTQPPPIVDPSKKGPGASVTLYALDGKKARPVTVIPGITDGMFTEVTGELSEGQAVVLDVARQQDASKSKDGAMNSQRGAAKGMKRAGM